MTLQTPQRLQDKFGHGQVVRFEAGQGGLTRAVVQTQAGSAEVYVHGAHVTAYQPRGHQPLLFLSRQSAFEPKKPIRGGVPICLPWFANETDLPNAPMHGFARLLEWQVLEVSVGPEAATLTFGLQSSADTRQAWPHDFAARFIVSVGPSLVMRLEMTNTGSAPFRFTEALHTYLAVGDVARVAVRGLEGAEYLDKLAAGQRRREGNEPITISGETDRIYLDTTAACVVEDAALSRRLVVSKAGSQTTVLWNPWIEKAHRMPDFGDDEWPGMLCIETCNVADHAVHLPPGQIHALEAELACQSL